MAGPGPGPDDHDMALRHRLLLLVTMVSLVLVAAGQAWAAGGRYVFAGGTPAQRAQVRAALNASSFNWSRVPAQITIHVVPEAHTHAMQGHIWVDAGLLSAGRFSWATIQHEYAHQVDFYLLDAASRAFLNTMLGGLDWCYSVSGLDHSAYGCERFASTLAWAYWRSPQNSLRPESGSDEAAAMAPGPFRALLSSLVASPAQLR